LLLTGSASAQGDNAAVVKSQGLITRAGYTEQAAAYNLMQQASGVTQQADNSRGWSATALR
jgi:hypothetical protein